MPETAPTLAPGSGDHDSPEGYGPNKVAAERVLLDSGLPVTVLRASKVHGAGARNPREWVFVQRLLDGRASCRWRTPAPSSTPRPRSAPRP